MGIEEQFFCMTVGLTVISIGFSIAAIFKKVALGEAIFLWVMVILLWASLIGVVKVQPQAQIKYPTPTVEWDTCGFHPKL